jgi:hypothetical protein
LFSWSFVTGLTGTFRHLLSNLPAVIRPQRAYLDPVPADRSFDNIVHAAGLPTVIRSSAVELRALCDNDAAKYLLLDAPEPLDDADRLRVFIDQTEATPLIYNLDRTRVLITPSKKLTLDSDHRIALVWSRAMGGEPEKNRLVAGDARPETWSGDIQL